MVDVDEISISSSKVEELMVISNFYSSPDVEEKGVVIAIIFIHIGI